MRWIENALNNDYKINDGRNFQFTKFSFTDFVLTDRRSLSGKQPKSASYKSSSCRFSFWAERNANTKATEYVTFGFSFVYWFFSLLGKFEPHCPSAIRIFFCIENCESFAIHSSTWPSGAKGEWRVSSWFAISIHVKNTIFFHLCCYGFSQGWKSLYNTAVYVLK